MIKRVVAVTAFAAGYVAGAAAGRERYEQIKRAANRVAEDPRVRRAIDDLGEHAWSFPAEPGVPRQRTRVSQ